MSARIVVIRVFIMMQAGKIIVRIVGILMRRVIVVHDTLTLVFHESFVTMELVFMFALALGNREWVLVKVGIRIRRFRARRSSKSLRPRRSRHRRWRTTGTSVRGGGPAATASGPGRSCFPRILEVVPEVESEAITKAEMGGLRGES